MIIGHRAPPFLVLVMCRKSCSLLLMFDHKYLQWISRVKIVFRGNAFVYPYNMLMLVVVWLTK